MEFNARKIMAMEKETKKSLFDLIANVSMETLLILVKHGEGLSEDDAFNFLDKKIREIGMMAFYLDILDVLQGEGFLPKALDIAEIRAKMGEKLTVQEVPVVEAQVVS